MQVQQRKYVKWHWQDCKETTLNACQLCEHVLLYFLRPIYFSLPVKYIYRQGEKKISSISLSFSFQSPLFKGESITVLSMQHFLLTVCVNYNVSSEIGPLSWNDQKRSLIIACFKLSKSIPSADAFIKSKLTKAMKISLLKAKRCIMLSP